MPLYRSTTHRRSYRFRVCIDIYAHREQLAPSQIRCFCFIRAQVLSLSCELIGVNAPFANDKSCQFCGVFFACRIRLRFIYRCVPICFPSLLLCPVPPFDCPGDSALSSTDHLKRLSMGCSEWNCWDRWSGVNSCYKLRTWPLCLPVSQPILYNRHRHIPLSPPNSVASTRAGRQMSPLNKYLVSIGTRHTRVFRGLIVLNPRQRVEHLVLLKSAPAAPIQRLLTHRLPREGIAHIPLAWGLWCAFGLGGGSG